MKQIEKAVYGKDNRFSFRVLRCLANTRRNINPNVLRRLVNGYYTHSVKEREALTAYIEEAMETDNDASKPSPRLRTGRNANAPLLPEIDAYLHMLVLLHLLDSNRNTDAVKCAGKKCNLKVLKLDNNCKRVIAYRLHVPVT